MERNVCSAAGKRTSTGQAKNNSGDRFLMWLIGVIFTVIILYVVALCFALYAENSPLGRKEKKIYREYEQQRSRDARRKID
jgi:hypothetical protein